MKKILLGLIVISTLLFSNFQFGFLRKNEKSLQENKKFLPEQQLKTEEPTEAEQPPQDEDQTQVKQVFEIDEPTESEHTQSKENNEEEQSNSENNEYDITNTDNNNENEDGNNENLELYLQKMSKDSEQVVRGLMLQCLKLNEERNMLLKQIRFFGIQRFIENPESITPEDIHEQANMLYDNQHVIENVKEINKQLEDILQQLHSNLQSKVSIQ